MQRKDNNESVAGTDMQRETAVLSQENSNVVLLADCKKDHTAFFSLMMTLAGCRCSLSMMTVGCFVLCGVGPSS